MKLKKLSRNFCALRIANWVIRLFCIFGCGYLIYSLFANQNNYTQIFPFSAWTLLIICSGFITDWVVVPAINYYGKRMLEQQRKMEEIKKTITWIPLQGCTPQEATKAIREVGEIVKGRMRHYCPSCDKK